MAERKVPRGFKRVRWTNAMKDQFFNTLAETCNILAASEAAGIRSQNAYELRRKDPAFAEEWGKALRCGYEVLETRLVALALDSNEDRSIDNGPHGRIDTDLALRMLTQHRNALLGKEKRGGPPLRRATREETDAAILRKIEMIEKARKAGVA